MAAEPSVIECQVAIVGGGPAGCSTALGLRQRGLGEVLVVEATDYGDVRIGESVPPDVRLLLSDLGVWRGFLHQRHEPCLGSCSIWGSEIPGFNDFLLNPHGHGWHLNRRRFDALLADKVTEAGAELWRETRCLQIERRGERGFELQLRGAGETRMLRARFVVDATGGAARIARRLGAVQRFHDRLSYLATFMRMEDGASMPSLTLLEAVEYGWWYAARLPARRVAVAVASDPEILKEEGLHRLDGWRAALRETRLVGKHLAGLEAVGEGLLARAAPSFLLDPIRGQGWLAVGDAASSYDPISSQGIYKALLDGQQAANAIADSLQGDDGHLEAYPAELTERFDDYLSNRNLLYGQERRWPAGRFWSRRHERLHIRAL